MDGGAHPSGDTLNFDAQGLVVTEGPNTLAAEGRQPVTYLRIETFNILNRLYRLFLALILKSP